MELRNSIKIFAVVLLIYSTLFSYNLLSPSTHESWIPSWIKTLISRRLTSSSVSTIISGKYNDNLYTRGKMHFLSMDSGMTAPCWTQTIKPLLQLACPNMTVKSDLELELAFILTSCYCESIGHPKLECDEDVEHREENRRDGGNPYYPDAELILCAQGQCYNEWNRDGFDIIYQRVLDLCYFYEYEAYHHNPDMKPFIPEPLLEEVLDDVKGTMANNWPRLPLLINLVNDEIQARHFYEKSWIQDSAADWWTSKMQMMVEDVNYWMGEMMEGFEDLLAYYYFH